MNGKHTPGPWYVAGDPHPKATHPEARQFAFFSNRFVATGPELDDEGTHAVVCSMMDGPEQVANAALIAAAPDMLEALRRLALAVEDIGAHGPGATRDEIIERMHRDDSGVLRQARAAIRKATGGEGGAR